MPFITREDGEHFVIPSYREVMPAKNKNALKRDIILLSKSYGEYITMQRKGADEYEVAFSPDTGYLLGESIWHHFKRPADLIYCEAIPNTTEAILVIVKSGSVYLDGSFPIDSIPEELVVFLTQQNHFEIYIYGDVPISEMAEIGKFSFDANSVKFFTVLDQPVFVTLPLLKQYQLRLVDTVLKAHSIGVFPLRQILVGIVVIGLLWMVYSYMTSKPEIVEQIIQQQSPYQGYLNRMTSPAPDREMTQFMPRLTRLYSLPGWTAQTIAYSNGNLVALVKSGGANLAFLSVWAQKSGATIDIRSDGVYVKMSFPLANRQPPQKIYPMNDILAKFIDSLAVIYPGNRLQMSSFINKGFYKNVTFTITLDKVPPAMLVLIGARFKDLPFVLKKMDLSLNNGSISGSITIEALGN